jgi:hypothetical protein
MKVCAQRRVPPAKLRLDGPGQLGFGPGGSGDGEGGGGDCACGFFFYFRFFRFASLPVSPIPVPQPATSANASRRVWRVTNLARKEAKWSVVTLEALTRWTTDD